MTNKFIIIPSTFFLLLRMITITTRCSEQGVELISLPSVVGRRARVHNTFYCGHYPHKKIWRSVRFTNQFPMDKTTKETRRPIMHSDIHGEKNIIEARGTGNLCCVYCPSRDTQQKIYIMVLRNIMVIL